MSPMHDAETRLREALHRAADGVDVDEYNSLDRIRGRAVRARNRRRVLAGGVGAAALVVAAIVVVPLAFDGDDDGLSVVPPAGTGDQGTSTTTDTTEPDAPTTTQPPDRPANVVFPATVEEATDDPVATVERFLDALDYGSHELAAVSEHGIDGASVPVLGLNEGGEPFRIMTTVYLQPQDGLWYVTGADSPYVQIDMPTAGAAVSSPVTVSGRGSGFEGQMNVTVRDAGLHILHDEGADEALPLAGNGEVLQPFTTAIPFVAEPGPGVIVVTNASGLENGAVDMAVVPVEFAPEGTTTLQVVLLDEEGESPRPVTRTVPKTTGVLNAAIGQLLSGPTPQESAAGFTSWFSAETANLAYTVNVRSDATAIVDFDARVRELIPNASTSAGSSALLTQLNGTVFQFPNIARVEYRLGGDCEAFWNWLQQSCHVVPRPE